MSLVFREAAAETVLCFCGGDKSLNPLIFVQHVRALKSVNRGEIDLPISCSLMNKFSGVLFPGTLTELEQVRTSEFPVCRVNDEAPQ